MLMQILFEGRSKAGTRSTLIDLHLVDRLELAFARKQCFQW
jgi:hypothetical protein